MDGRVHSFRHYFISQAFLSGVGEGEIMAWVGHRDSQMVAHYRHLGNADARRKMNQIDFWASEAHRMVRSLKRPNLVKEREVQAIRPSEKWKEAAKLGD